MPDAFQLTCRHGVSACLVFQRSGVCRPCSSKLIRSGRCLLRVLLLRLVDTYAMPVVATLLANLLCVLLLELLLLSAQPTLLCVELLNDLLLLLLCIALAGCELSRLVGCCRA